MTRKKNSLCYHVPSESTLCWYFRLPPPAMKKLCDVQAYQEIYDFIFVRIVIRCTYKSDNTRCHATPKTTTTVEEEEVVVVAAAAIPYRIIPLSLPTSTQNLSSITVKILNMPDQPKITHTGRGSERWRVGRGERTGLICFPCVDLSRRSSSSLRARPSYWHHH